MSCDLSATEIRDRIAALEHVKTQRLMGKQVTKSTFPETGSVEFAQSTLAEIDMELTRLRVLLSRLGGCPSPVRPVRPGFGTRA